MEGAQRPGHFNGVELFSNSFSTWFSPIAPISVKISATYRSLKFSAFLNSDIEIPRCPIQRKVDLPWALTNGRLVQVVLRPLRISIRSYNAKVYFKKSFHSRNHSTR
jgi:hypothetical protein